MYQLTHLLFGDDVHPAHKYPTALIVSSKVFPIFMHRPNLVPARTIQCPTIHKDLKVSPPCLIKKKLGEKGEKPQKSYCFFKSEADTKSLFTFFDLVALKSHWFTQDNCILLDLYKCGQDHSAGKNSQKLLSCLHICLADPMTLLQTQLPPTQHNSWSYKWVT